MSDPKGKVVFFIPVCLGLFALFSGGILVMNEDPLFAAGGIGLLMWLPGCAYFAWKAYNNLKSQARISAGCRALAESDSQNRSGEPENSPSATSSSADDRASAH